MKSIIMQYSDIDARWRVWLLAVSFLLLLSFPSLMKAQTEESVSGELSAIPRYEISVITVSPSPETPYTLYGHTAVRVIDHIVGTDAVYNYGVFDFNEPNFTLNFIQGKPEYWVDKRSYGDFFYEYTYFNRGFSQQILNLTDTEAELIVAALEENILPENCRYLYNFIFDNCANRPMMLFESVLGKIELVPLKNNGTFREWIEECTKNNSWQIFGINLALGAGTDSYPDTLADRFLPVMVEETLRNGRWMDRGEKPLIVREEVLFTPDPLFQNATPKTWTDIVTPTALFSLLLLLHLVILVVSYRKNSFTVVKSVETLLLIVAGIAGCVIWYISLLSNHPFTFPNYNMLLLHPFHFITVWMIWKKDNGSQLVRRWTILLAGLILLCILITLLLRVQSLSVPIYLLAFLLLLCYSHRELAQNMRRLYKKAKA
ncbi:lipoprotein N-acyltransferase Lnb domain-containing protein [Porphyromonas canoris]|nr:DUF4105 domain-containing protein [Porphyromonas canoris]